MTILYKNQLSVFLKSYSVNLWKTLERWAASPLFAYITIFLLQLKRVWGAWQYRDLTSGDTSAYFMSAVGWAQEYSVKIHWSPLYTAYYGTVFKFVPDVYWATLIHRFVIVIALAILILAVMRCLLPAHIAWLVAAWWVILPINFNSLYEVHLFSVLLPLAATLLVLYKPGMWTRGAALGILLVSMLLVRNEIIVAVCLWVFICLIWEIRELRLRRGKVLKVYLLAYGAPILFATLVFGFFSWRTLIKPSPESLRRKHTLNVCQIYAFGYQQRHSDWQKSPWMECQDLMIQVFSKPEPSMIEAFQSNPRAMLGHYLWNIRLLPAGLQVSLFNATLDYVNPDYAPVLLDSSIVLIPSLLVLGLFVIGMVQLYREKSYWWRAWLSDRVWGWAMLFCLSAVMLLVIPMQRPRPSYMFLLTLFLMAIVGMCLFIATHRIAMRRHFQRLASVVMITLPFFMPSFFSIKERPLLNLYKKLAPSQEFIGIPGTGFVTLGYSQELCNYFTKNSVGSCVGYTYNVFDNMNDDNSVGEILAHQPLPVIALFVENNFLAAYGSIPSVQKFLANPEAEGWKLVYFEDNSSGTWRLYINIQRSNDLVP